MIAVILWFWAMGAITTAYGAWVAVAIVLAFVLGWDLGRISYFVWGGIALAAIPVSTGWLVLFICLALLSLTFEQM